MDEKMAIARRKVRRLREAILLHKRTKADRGMLRHLALWRHIDELRDELDHIPPPAEVKDDDLSRLNLGELATLAGQLESAIRSHFRNFRDADADEILHALVPESQAAAA